jgi:hypothetical protein
LFAIYCLFDDLNRLRHYISNLWIQYKTNRLDLIAASFATNTAIQLAVRSQADILSLFPAFMDYQGVLATLLTQHTVQKGNEDGTMEVVMDDDEAQWIFTPAHSMLDSFCDILEPGQTPIMKRGHFGV